MKAILSERAGDASEALGDRARIEPEEILELSYRCVGELTESLQFDDDFTNV
ncbi:MAG: hypothetical protein ACREPA_12635 [Candidatus Dormibacteraceae bacterium]